MGGGEAPAGGRWGGFGFLDGALGHGEVGFVGRVLDTVCWLLVFAQCVTDWSCGIDGRNLWGDYYLRWLIFSLMRAKEGNGCR